MRVALTAKRGLIYCQILSSLNFLKCDYIVDEYIITHKETFFNFQNFVILTNVTSFRVGFH